MYSPAATAIAANARNSNRRTRIKPCLLGGSGRLGGARLSGRLRLPRLKGARHLRFRVEAHERVSTGPVEQGSGHCIVERVSRFIGREGADQRMTEQVQVADGI